MMRRLLRSWVIGLASYHSFLFYPVVSFQEFIPRFYYQIATPTSKMHKVTIQNEPFLIYHYNGSYHSIYDKCPHQGASLSKGWINARGNVHCPYHGFEFDRSGHFCGIPDSLSTTMSPRKCRKYLPTQQVFRHDGDMYICPSLSLSDQDAYQLPYYPPEHFNKEFVRTQGRVMVNKAQNVITENVLDMLHISYVHSFGNRELPLPFDVQFCKLSDTSGKAIFKYKPFRFTISNQVGRSPVVVVENEYHLPTTTITRVIAGHVVKTVMTRATPISDNETLFFWSVYRNFWRSEEIPLVTWFGDVLMSFLMDRTIKEDLNILKDVYTEAQVGSLITKYDVTIQQYRQARMNYLDRIRTASVLTTEGESIRLMGALLSSFRNKSAATDPSDGASV